MQCIVARSLRPCKTDRHAYAAVDYQEVLKGENGSKERLNKSSPQRNEPCKLTTFFINKT
jgi:hypothetical protein